MRRASWRWSRAWRTWAECSPCTPTTTFRTTCWRRFRLPDVDLRVLGVDPGLVATGYGLLAAAPGGVTVVDTGIVQTEATLSLDARISLIYDGIDRLLEK